MCRNLLAVVGLAVVMLVGAVAAGAEEGAPALTPAIADGGSCLAFTGSVVEAPADGDLSGQLFQPEAQPAVGCSATYNCVHGTIVSCSSPFIGTCQSSGQRCGRVTCNGVTTWCPGACAFAHHCARFCDIFNNPDSFCDSGGCCVCQ